jgi:hypothetical protein
MSAAPRKRIVITDNMLRQALRIDATVSTVGDGDLPIELCTWDERTIIVSFVTWLRAARKAAEPRQRRAAMRQNVIQGGKG